jgi:ankyrin repeat protein
MIFTILSTVSLCHTCYNNFTTLYLLQDGWTSLYVAAQNGHDQVVKTLIKAGAAKVDLPDKVSYSCNYALL